MCGITGLVEYKIVNDETIIERMTDSLFHRGPDSGDCKTFNLNSWTISLGHRRLSILDLSDAGKQPMQFEDLTIVYNGEVYNFLEIKKELEKVNYSFSTSSDTEVILKAFHKWGIDAIQKFNGMFAFALFDNKRQKLYLVRDRAGIKPLYYFNQNDLFLFSSELKSFHKHPSFKKEINNDSLALYFQYGYIPSPHTIFKNTFKLNPGAYLEVDLITKNIQEVNYWNVLNYYNKPKINITKKEATQEVYSLLKSACNYRMIADVPIGVFLSGGYDSSLVTSIIQSDKTDKIKTFTISFKDAKYNEGPFAKQVADVLQTDHTDFLCSEKEAQDIIPLLPDFFDEPFADSSSIPTYLVSKLARRYVKVALSADAGDETFAGYTKYEKALSNWSKLSLLPSLLRPMIGAGMGFIKPEYLPLGVKKARLIREYETVKTLLCTKESNSGLLLKLMSERLNQIELRKLFKVNFNPSLTYFDSYSSLTEDSDSLNTLLALDYKTYLPDDILTKVDRTTMAVSLEGREPLLDFRLIEFVAQLPSSLKIKDGIKKYLLKEITHQHIPNSIMDRPKKGFGIPVKDWCRKELIDIVFEFIDEKNIEKQGIFNSSYVIKKRNEYLSGQDDSWEFIWFMLIFQMWYKRWIES